MGHILVSGADWSEGHSRIGIGQWGIYWSVGQTGQVGTGQWDSLLFAVH